MSNIVTYPVTPKNVDESVIQPSADFKKEVLKVLTSIIFFIGVYLLLMTAAIGLSAVCAAAGILLVTNYPRFITLMIGLGLVGLGILVVFFLLKFLFKSNKTDRSHLVEVTEQEQPELFAFIKTLTKETHAPFPKRIYLSADVNACVFYDSSFWSMFFPIRKNLQIGLGLVNSVNLSEFKAILAHEFGHFSQRSMKLGSYVYNVNQIIYNMLYDNEGYGKTLEGFANISGYFAFFAGITVRIVTGIQWLLQKVYSLVNKNYMSLSRQMEFHADSVAAYVSGSDHLITSLRRLEVADNLYNSLFEYYNDWLKQNLKPDNIYPQHSEMMRCFAEEHKIPMKMGLPEVNAQTFAHLNRTRVLIKDQWASHPSTDDREAHLRNLNIHAEVVNISAWHIFRNAMELQTRLTEKIYRTVSFANKPQTLDFVSFQNKYKNQVERYKLDSRYRNFFNFRNISKIDLNSLTSAGSHYNSLEEILDDEMLSLPLLITGINEDINTLQQIENRSYPVKTFEFEGVKNSYKEASGIIARLKNELSETENKLLNADRKIITFFIQAADAAGEGDKLKERYQWLFNNVDIADTDLKVYFSLIQDLQPLYQGDLEIDQVRQLVHQVKLDEVPLRERLREIMDDNSFKPFLSTEDRQKVEVYLSKDQVYFSGDDFNNESLTLLTENLGIFQGAITERVFDLKKEILLNQLTYVN